MLSFHSSAIAFGIHLPSTLMTCCSPFLSMESPGSSESSKPGNWAVNSSMSGRSGMPLTLIVAVSLSCETISTLMSFSLVLISVFHGSPSSSLEVSAINLNNSLPVSSRNLPGSMPLAVACLPRSLSTRVCSILPIVSSDCCISSGNASVPPRFSSIMAVIRSCLSFSRSPAWLSTSNSLSQSCWSMLFTKLWIRFVTSVWYDGGSISHNSLGSSSSRSLMGIKTTLSAPLGSWALGAAAFSIWGSLFCWEQPASIIAPIASVLRRTFFVR